MADDLGKLLCPGFHLGEISTELQITRGKLTCISTRIPNQP